MENSGNPLNIILLGDSAAGKATHGKYLAKKYRLYDLDMGRELRGLEHNKVLRKRILIWIKLWIAASSRPPNWSGTYCATNPSHAEKAGDFI